MEATTGQPAGYDADGMLRLDGRRCFVLGAYSAPSGSPADGRTAWRELADLGLHVVRARATDEDLDAARTAGLRAWVTVGCVDGQDAAERAEFEATVRRLRGHPALLFWETVDEPAWTWNQAAPRVPPEPLIASYALLKGLDSERLAYLNHAPTNLVSTLRAYAPATDITACDIYPVIPVGMRTQYALFPDGLQGDLLNTTIGQVGDYTTKMRRVAGPGRPLFMVLQGFAWEMLRDANDRNPEMVLYPTYAQSRFMAYDATVRGATGLLYWGLHRTPRQAPFWDDLQCLWRELASLDAALSAPRVRFRLRLEYFEIGHSVDRGVRVLAKRIAGVTYLLTVNEDRVPVRVRIEAEDPFGAIRVLGEDGEASVSGGALVADYAPFDVHVYAWDART